MTTPHAWWIGKRWRVAAVVLLLGAIVALSGIRSWPDQIRGMVPGTKTDEFYRYVAQQLNEPALCEKIPWSVKVPGGFFMEPSYERSECYHFITGRTKNPWLCRKVKRLGAFSLLSNQTSMWSYLADAVHGWNGGIGIAPADFSHFFKQLGYDPDKLHLEGITPPIVSVKDIYRQLPARPDIATRIAKAIGPFDKTASLSPGDIVNSAYLADMAGFRQTYRWPASVRNSVIGVCSRSPPTPKTPNSAAASPCARIHERRYKTSATSRSSHLIRTTPAMPRKCRKTTIEHAR
jgi:hypothetical protein